MAEQKAKVTVVCRVCGTASQAEFVIDEIDQPRHNLAVANVLAGTCTCQEAGTCKWCKIYNADDGELAGIIDERLRGERERLEKLRETIKKKSDRAYCDCIDQLRKPECLGWEAKVKAGKFDRAEFHAHEKAQELFGRHKGLVEAQIALAEYKEAEGE